MIPAQISVIAREEILDSLFGNRSDVLRELHQDPEWEENFITGMWFRRSYSFIERRDAAKKCCDEMLPGVRQRLAELLTELAPLLPLQSDGEPGAIEPTSKQPYVSFLSTAATPPMAWEHWRWELLSYVGKPDGKGLIWRTRPETEYQIDFATGKPLWGIYARAVTVQLD